MPYQPTGVGAFGFSLNSEKVPGDEDVARRRRRAILPGSPVLSRPRSPSSARAYGLRVARDGAARHSGLCSCPAQDPTHRKDG